jgi:hypothetical protein
VICSCEIPVEVVAVVVQVVLEPGRDRGVDDGLLHWHERIVAHHVERSTRTAQLAGAAVVVLDRPEHREDVVPAPPLSSRCPAWTARRVITDPAEPAPMTSTSTSTKVLSSRLLRR